MKKIFILLIMCFFVVFCYAQCPPENQCTYTVQMHDSYGDGWDDAALLVKQGTTTVATMTISGGPSNTVTFSVCRDSIYTLHWSAGSWDDEASFELLSPSGHVMYSCADCSSLSTTSSIFSFTACVECYAPSLNLTNMLNSTAYFSWGSFGASEWQIISGPAATTSISSTSSTEIDTFYVMQNLTTNTEYILYIRTVCDASSQQYSGWDSLTFIYQEPLLIPYTCDFETATDSSNWTIINGTNGWYFGSDTANASTNNNYLYVSNDGGFTNAYSNISTISLAYIPLSFGNANDYILSFDCKSIGEGYSYDVLYVCLVPLNITLETSISYSLPSWISTYQIAKLYEKTSWQTQDYLIHGSDVNNLAQRLVFVWKNDSYDNYNPPAAVDNISFIEAPCSSIDSTVISNHTINSVDITPYSQNATDFVLYYKAEEDSAYTSVNISTTSQFTLNNLMAGTRYLYYVISDCGNGAYGFPSDISSFITSCDIITTFPWTESFENDWIEEAIAPSNAASPICWQNYNYGYSSPYYSWGSSEVGSMEAHSGNKVAQFNGGYSSSATYINNDWLLTPILTLTGGERLNFYAKASYEGYSDDIAVYIIDVSTADVSSFSDLTTNAVCIMNSALVSYTNWSFYEISLTNYTGDFRIAFVRNNNPGGSFLYIDDISVSEMPNCPNVYNLSIEPSTSTSLAVTFNTANSIGSGWEILYAPTGSFDPNTATSVTAPDGSTFPIVINNLVQGTYYTFAVRQNCGGAWSDTVSAVIPLGEEFVSIPYTCGFETATDNSPWVFINGTYPNQWMIGSDVASTGDSSLYISNDTLHNTYSSANYESSLVAAYIDVTFDNAEQYNLSFDWHAQGESGSYSAYDYMIVCVVPLTETLDFSNSYNLPSWISSYQISDRLHSNSTWQEESIVILGSEVNNTVKRLLFIWKNDSSNDNNPAAAVDNISITPLLCSAPSNVVVTPSVFEATVSWTTPATTTEWIISLYSNNSWVDSLVYDNPTIISGLSANTDYQLHVYSLCNGGADTSMYINTVSFTTACTAYTPPFIEDFTGGVPPTDCWSQASGSLDVNSTLSYGSSSWDSRSSELVNGGGNHPVLNQYSNDVNGWLISPTIDLGDGSISYQVDFDVQLTSYNYSSIGGAPETTNTDDRFAVVVSTDNGTTWSTANATIWDNDINTNTFTLNDLANQVHHIEIPLTDISGNPYTGFVKIALFAESTVTNADNDLHIDNFAVNPLASCTFPTNTSVSNIDQTSALITWSPGDDEISWEIIIDTVGADISTATASVVTDTFYNAIGLTENTDYIVYIRAICVSGSGTSSFITVLFTTICDAVTTFPYAVNFDNYTAGHSAFPDCWFAPVRYNYAPYITDGQSSSAPNSLFFSSLTTNPTTAVSPQLADDIHTLQVSFKIKAENISNSGTFEVGVMSDPNDVSTFESVQVITPIDNSTFYEYTVYFSQTTMSGFNRHIAFRQNSNSNYYYYWLDDVVIDNIPSCITPVNPSANTITTTTIEVEWTEIGTATAWSIEYGPSGFTQGNGTLVSTTTNPYTVSGLTANTAYDFYFQTDCGGGDVSDWSDAFTVTTACNTINTFPYIEDFENNGLMPGCWSQAYITGTADWIFSTGNFGSSINSAHSGSYNALFFNTNSTSTKLISPIFDLTQVQNPYLSYWISQADWSNDQDQLIVYYRTGSTDTWTQLVQYTNSITAWTFDSLALPNPSATYQIAFEGYSNYGRGVTLDDITIYDGANVPTTCTTPTGLAAVPSDVTANITWAAGGTETAWIVEYKLASATTWTPVNVTTTPAHTLTGLTVSTDYNVRVKAVCGATDESAYTAIVNFTTLAEPCDVPTNVQVVPSSNGATVTWTSTESAWIVGYRLAGSANWTESQTLTTTTYQIVGLQQSTDYEVRVKSVCSPGESAFTANVAFTTIADGTTTYTITASATGPGTITPSGVSSVQEGANITYTLTPETGNIISMLLVDDVETAVPTDNQYTFTNVTANHTIAVTFTTGINEIVLDKAVTLYPNPASTMIELMVSNDLLIGREAVIYDVYGKQIAIIPIEGEKTQIDISNFASGVYVVRITADQGMVMKKFIKK